MLLRLIDSHFGHWSRSPLLGRCLARFLVAVDNVVVAAYSYSDNSLQISIEGPVSLGAAHDYWIEEAIVAVAVAVVPAIDVMAAPFVADIQMTFLEKYLFPFDTSLLVYRKQRI